MSNPCECQPVKILETGEVFGSCKALDAAYQQSEGFATRILNETPDGYSSALNIHIRRLSTEEYAAGCCNKPEPVDPASSVNRGLLHSSKCVKVMETGQCFSSRKMCDDVLGLYEGATADAITRHDGYYPKRGLHFVDITTQEYAAYINSPDYVVPVPVARPTKPEKRYSASGKLLKVCKFCGREFEARHHNQSYCDDQHFGTCEICGTQFPVTVDRIASGVPHTCGNRECKIMYKRKSAMAKYGVPSVQALSEVQKKREATTTARYGVPNIMQSKEIRDKMAADRLKRTGYAWSGQDPELQHRVEDTNLKKYGVRRPAQHPEIKDKIATTMQQKYHTTGFMVSEEFREKSQQTMVDRYGAPYLLQTPDGQAAHQAALQERYRVTAFSQSAAWKAQRIGDPTKLDNLLAFQADPVSYIQSKFESRPTIVEVAESIGTGTGSVTEILYRFKCQELVAYVKSQMEREVEDVLRTFAPDAEIQINTHRVITPYELDFYLPEYHFAIECNPTSTHNSSRNEFNPAEPPTTPKYHFHKSQMCRDKGIFLLHIFGPEWKYRRPVLISIIQNVLGQNSRTIGARTTTVKPVPYDVSLNFLESNHRQGSTATPVRLGLYTAENELVSLMTFGPLRHTIGKASSGESNWELVRFASVLGTSVVGGASKLLKHFEAEYSPKYLRSYSDVAHTRGSVYQKLGFKQVHYSEPGYVWVRKKDDRAFSRINAQKRNIRKFLQDDTIDIDHLTERQIMESHGFVSVYDSGTILWEKHYD